MPSQSGEDYRALVEQTPLALRRLDRAGRCVYANPACVALTGRGAGELLGDGWAALIHGEDRPAYEAAVARALAHGEPFALELRLRQGDGAPGDDKEYRWLLEQAQPLHTPAGEPAGLVSQLVDIHRRKEVERMRSVAMSFVAHEQRTPLMASRLLIELNRRRAANGRAPDEALLDKLLLQHRRLDRLAADLSETARQELALPLALRPAPLCLSTLLEETVELQRLRLEDQNRPGCSHQLGLRLPPMPLWVLADRDRVAQVLANLLDNAIRYMPAGGELELAAEAAPAGGTEHCVLVRDRGTGIPADELPFVTERFYRGSAAELGQIPGSGLGLAISEALVVAHGGRLTIDSEPQRGTTVRFTLPVAEPA